MPPLETSGYKRFRELKQFIMKDGEGNTHAVEGFMNMTTGKFHAVHKGWNGVPPPLPAGEKTPETGSKFKNNYSKTFGHD